MIEVMGQPAIGLDHGASLRRSPRTEQRQPGRQVGPRPAGADLPGGHRLAPSRPPGGQRDPGHRVGLDHVRRGAPGVPGPPMHCTAAYGGTRTSTALPGARPASSAEQVGHGAPQRLPAGDQRRRPSPRGRRARTPGRARPGRRARSRRAPPGRRAGRRRRRAAAPWPCARADALRGPPPSGRPARLTLARLARAPSAEQGRQHARWAAASSSSGTAKPPSTSRPAAPDRAQWRGGDAVRRAQPGELRLRPGRHRDHRPRRRLAEQERERVAGQAHPAAVPAGQAGLGQRDGEPAVGQVVRRGQQAVRGRRRRAAPRPAPARHPGRPRAGGRRGGRAPPAPTPTRRTRARSRRAAPAGAPAGRTRSAPGAARRRARPAPRPPGWAGSATVAGLVVEADVAAGHRDAQGRRSRRRGRAPPRRTATSPPGPPASRSSGSWSRRPGGRRWPPRSGTPRPARAGCPRTGRAGSTGRCRRWRAPRPRPVCSSTRITPASSGIASTVSPRTCRSYCSVTQVLSASVRASRAGPAAPRAAPPAVARPRQRGRVVGGQRVLAGRAGGGPVVDRALVGGGLPGGMSTTCSPCQVISSRPVPVTSPMTVAGTSQRAQMARKRSTSPGVDDGHHAFLRLAHQDLGRAERGVAQRHGVQVDPHAGAAARGQLGRRAGRRRPRPGPGCRPPAPPRTAPGSTRPAASP